MVVINKTDSDFYLQKKFEQREDLLPCIHLLSGGFASKILIASGSEATFQFVHFCNAETPVYFDKLSPGTAGVTFLRLGFPSQNELHMNFSPALEHNYLHTYDKDTQVLTLSIVSDSVQNLKYTLKATTGLTLSESQYRFELHCGYVRKDDVALSISEGNLTDSTLSLASNSCELTMTNLNGGSEVINLNDDIPTEIGSSAIKNLDNSSFTLTITRYASSSSDHSEGLSFDISK